MSRRPPSLPPQLNGYEYENLLGSGGFADVFLYRQFRPQRRVAIKVLLSSVLDESVRDQFDGEANVMAQMSTHPSIVTIHQAEVSEDHRPYIVMEYCPRPNYGLRFRRERITVAEALRVGVQIAGAVETAHRAGILHRDIKPANILVTDYNRPALTDFGISIATGQGHEVEDSQGMSIPWSPPEYFADPPRASARSDVFSLAATVYSLLAGQTPFEHPGRRNSAADLIHRISTEPLAPPTRPDVPADLNRVLAIAMAKSPSGRYDTALAFGRGLQQVELALSLPVTQMDILDERGSGEADRHEDDELEMHTRIRKVATVDPDSGTTGVGGRRRLDPYAGVAPALGAAAPGTSGPMPFPSAVSGSSAASASAAPVEETVRRPAGAHYAASSGSAAPPAAEHVPERAEPRRTPAWPFVTLAALVVIGLGAGTTFLVRHLAAPEPEQRATVAVNEPLTAPAPPGRPRAVTVTVLSTGTEGRTEGKTQIAWEHPENFQEGYFYQVRWKDLPENYDEFAGWQDVEGRTGTTLNTPPGLTGLCLEVRTVSPDGPSSEPEVGCQGGT